MGAVKAPGGTTPPAGTTPAASAVSGGTAWPRSVSSRLPYASCVTPTAGGTRGKHASSSHAALAQYSL